MSESRAGQRACGGYAGPGAVLTAIAWLAVPAAASDAMIAILDGSSAPALLKQCSRSAPPPGETTWMPTKADVARLETMLLQALADVGRGSVPDGADVLARRSRQYVGIVRGGRRFLYGNFIPANATMHSPDWRLGPIIVCDGGPSIFGVEMDVEKASISHLDFNGR